MHILTPFKPLDRRDTDPGCLGETGKRPALSLAQNENAISPITCPWKPNKHHVERLDNLIKTLEIASTRFDLG